MPVGLMFTHAMMLGGMRRRIKCLNCQHFSYLPRDKRNVVVPLSILAVAAIATLSPVLDDYLAQMTKPWPGIVRAELWALAILSAFGLFALRGRLVPLQDEAPWPRGLVRTMMLDWAFLLLMAFWGYVMFRGVTT
jgi:hypothetical protein